jgi:hypothetical protein
MIQPTEYLKLEESDLIQRHANAKLTGMVCGGHTKSRMNKNLVRDYEVAMEWRGMKINPEAEENGVFNGKGAT